MKRLTWILTAALALAATACSDSSNNVWDDLPEGISEFIAMYFPEQGVSKYVESDGEYYVTLKDGPEIIFNSERQWIAMDGRGATLPTMFIFDQMPSPLYAYLQNAEAVDKVYKATRDASGYVLTLANETVTYSYADGISVK